MKTCLKSGCDIDVELTERRCPACDTDQGYQNVRRARSEHSHLQDFYDDAVKQTQGVEVQVHKFEHDLKASHVVVNMDARMLEGFLQDESAVYMTYYGRTLAGAKRPTSDMKERKRAAVDMLVFGLDGQNIRFGALSLDGRGLTSYGAFSVTLNENMIEERTSLMVENSFHFAKDVRGGNTEQLPKGRICVWDDRCKLAIGKLATEIKASTQPQDFAGILLDSTGDRDTDKFIEVHINGPFNRGWFSGVKGPSLGEGDKLGRQKTSSIVNSLENSPISWGVS